MPPKKKQTPRNAFYFFMQDFKSRQGINLKGMQEVAIAAGPHWSKMSREQRRPYEEKARIEKGNMRAAKLTSDGLDVEALEDEERQEQIRIEEMKDYIKGNISMASRNGRIQDEMFFLIHINTFCFCSSENRHYPAEIAIVGFSLDEGVLPQNTFHRFIKPGVLPLGYASDASLHSRETHQIKVPLAEDHMNNVAEVYAEMKEFLSDKLTGSKRMPVLYTEEKLLKMVQQVLDMWCYDFREDGPLFNVYNLQYMFRVLRNTVAEENVWPSDTYSSREIEKDVYAYAKGISCDYHEVTNVPIHCSKSTAIRYAFVICDNCCPDLKITLVPGVHIPETASTPHYRSSSRASLASSKYTKSSNLKASTRDDDDTDSVMSFSSKSEWDNQSVTSDASTNLTDDENFPSLGGAKKQASPNSWRFFSPNDSSSAYSQASSTRSYAGAMGTSGLSKRPADMPSSLTDSMEKLQINSGKSAEFASIGRGRRQPTSFNNDSSEFPALGRARALAAMARGTRRPNQGE